MDIQSAPQAEGMPPRKPARLDPETMVTLAGTVFSVLLVVLTAMNAGPLWRDEVNTANLGPMSVPEMWRNLSFESFPVLCPLLLHGCSVLGLADSDASIRVLGLCVGLFLLGSLWLCARWLGGRAPSLSIPLLTWLPAFVFIVGSNRAYGLATGLLVLTFGTIWRLVESPAPRRIFVAGVTCLLFAHCVYYDVVFLAAMLAAGAVVANRRRQWTTLWMLIGIGTVTAASMAIYLPVIRPERPYLWLLKWPYFNFHFLWQRLGEALTIRSSADVGSNASAIWLWVGLFAGGAVAARLLQRPGRNPADPVQQKRADLAMYCGVSMVLGVLGFLAFLIHMQFLTQKWYYVEMLCLCSISLDGLLGALRAGLRPWGLVRIVFLVGLLTWGAKAAWNEAHTRRSNVDLVAAYLAKQAAAGDFIVVEDAWEGITFNRYYHGQVPWVTVPPIDSHLVHRNDLVFAMIQYPEAMAPVLYDITNALQEGHSVWLVGDMTASHLDRPRLEDPDQWIGNYWPYWNSVVATVLQEHAAQQLMLNMPPVGPVCALEELPLTRFVGYRAGGTRTIQHVPAN